MTAPAAADDPTATDTTASDTTASDTTASDTTAPATRAGSAAPPDAPRPGLTALQDDVERVLVVVAHPDDIEYGTAAAVDRWTAAGTTVTYLLATRGEAGIDGIPPEQAGPLRAQEERDGAAKVGVEIVEFLDFPDGTVEYGMPLRRAIAREIRRRRPDLVVTMSFEVFFAGGMTNQADHRAVGLATLDAVRDAANRWIFRELAEQEGLAPWGGVRAVLLAAANEPTHYVDVTGHLDAAIASLEAHEQYNVHLPDDFPKPAQLVTSILTGGAQLAAVEGVEHAVAFRLLGA